MWKSLSFSHTGGCSRFVPRLFCLFHRHWWHVQWLTAKRMKRDQARKDFYVLHKTRHQNTDCQHNFSLHEAADFRSPQDELSGEAHSEMCWPCLVSACRSSAEAWKLSAFHPTQHTHTEAGDPHSCQNLAWLSHTQYYLSHYDICPHIWREGRNQPAELPIRQGLSCSSGRQKGVSSGLHACIHAAQLRTCTENTCSKSTPTAICFLRKRDTGMADLVSGNVQASSPLHTLQGLAASSYPSRKVNHQGLATLSIHHFNSNALWSLSNLLLEWATGGPSCHLQCWHHAPVTAQAESCAGRREGGSCPSHYRSKYLPLRNNIK